jgi:hypothetical protein
MGLTGDGSRGRSVASDNLLFHPQIKPQTDCVTMTVTAADKSSLSAEKNQESSRDVHDHELERHCDRCNATFKMALHHLECGTMPTLNPDVAIQD